MNFKLSELRISWSSSFYYVSVDCTKVFEKALIQSNLWNVVRVLSSVRANQCRNCVEKVTRRVVLKNLMKTIMFPILASYL